MDILNRQLSRFAVLMLAAAALSGCYTDFEPDIDHEPVLCMNSDIRAGQPVSLSLSHTWRYSRPETDVRVTDADVDLFVDGRHVGKMRSDSVYLSDYVARPGDLIRFEARSSRYGSACAEVVVPQPPTVELASAAPSVTAAVCVPMDEEEGYIMVSASLKAGVRITDRAGHDDYYQFSWNAVSDNVKYCWVGTLDYEAEPLFSEHFDALESVFESDVYGFSVFTDLGFPGRKYTLRADISNIMVVLPLSEEAVTASYAERLVVSSISKSIYDWYMYDWYEGESFTGSLGSIGFAETIMACSNVSTGAGIVGASADASVEVDMTPYIRDAIDSVKQNNMLEK